MVVVFPPHEGDHGRAHLQPVSVRSLQRRRPPQPQDQPVQVVRFHRPSVRGEGVLQQLQPQLLLRGPLRDLRGNMVRGNSLLPTGRRGEEPWVCTPVPVLLPIAVIQDFLSLFP